MSSIAVLSCKTSHIIIVEHRYHPTGFITVEAHARIHGMVRKWYCQKYRSRIVRSNRFVGSIIWKQLFCYMDKQRHKIATWKIVGLGTSMGSQEWEKRTCGNLGGASSSIINLHVHFFMKFHKRSLSHAKQICCIVFVHAYAQTYRYTSRDFMWSWRTWSMQWFNVLQPSSWRASVLLPGWLVGCSL